MGVTKLGLSAGAAGGSVVWMTGLTGEALASAKVGNGCGKDRGRLLSTRLFLLAVLVLGLGLRELAIGLATPLLLPTSVVVAGVMTET